MALPLGKVGNSGTAGSIVRSVLCSGAVVCPAIGSSTCDATPHDATPHDTTPHDKWTAHRATGVRVCGHTAQRRGGGNGATAGRTSLGRSPAATPSSIAVVVIREDMRGRPKRRPISMLTWARAPRWRQHAKRRPGVPGSCPRGVWRATMRIQWRAGAPHLRDELAGPIELADGRCAVRRLLLCLHAVVGAVAVVALVVVRDLAARRRPRPRSTRR